MMIRHTIKTRSGNTVICHKEVQLTMKRYGYDTVNMCDAHMAV